MSSFGYYAFGSTYGSNSQMLDCTRTPHMHYYSDELFHFKEWLHMPSSLRASKTTTTTTKKTTTTTTSMKGLGSTNEHSKESLQQKIY
ncbi:hypothetical protein PMIN06_010665 [Paraphaeosphaeria minitans]